MNKCLVVLMFLCAACAQPDEKRIIGRWQSDDEWYRYYDNKTYDAGRSMITMVRGFKYAIHPDKRELIMYTDDETQTYYLQYSFVHNDTLHLANALNTGTQYSTFYRVK